MEGKRSTVSQGDYHQQNKLGIKITNYKLKKSKV
jgi:hypothetical protein